MDDDTTAPDPAADDFHALLAVEGVETGDQERRFFTQNALTWRDLPIPLMASDESSHGEMASLPKTLIGNIERIERVDDELHGYGSFLSNPSERAAYLIGLVQSGELVGISVDLDTVSYDVMVPVPSADEETAGDEAGDLESVFAPDDVETDEDGNRHEIYRSSMESAAMIRITEGRIMGATVVTFPALQEAFIEPGAGAVVASAEQMRSAGVHGYIFPSSLVAAITAPDEPRFDDFFVSEPDRPQAIRVDDNGVVTGHLAAWGTCHVGLPGCTTAPRSPSNYSRFHTGEVLCDDGRRVAVGQMTFGTGHAALKLRAAEAAAHYDNTGMVAADVRAVDGEHGIWLSGVLRSNMSKAEVREFMAAPPSGDWRSFGGSLELVGVLSVNVPGFNVPRESNVVSVRMDDEAREPLVASLVVHNPGVVFGTGDDCACGGGCGGVDEVMALRVIDQIAASVGLSVEQELSALDARVEAKAG